MLFVKVVSIDTTGVIASREFNVYYKDETKIDITIARKIGTKYMIEKTEKAIEELK